MQRRRLFREVHQVELAPRIDQCLDELIGIPQVNVVVGSTVSQQQLAAQILSERGRADAAMQLLKPSLESKRLFGARKNAEALLVKLSSN